MTSELLDNRYNVLSSLGRGGFGETCLAADTQMPSRGRGVIKQLRRSTDSPDTVRLVRERCSREAAILESVGEHPQIPTLYAYLVRGDRFYLIQEWIEGQTLTQLLAQRGTLTDAEVTAMLQQLLSILSYVHDRGLIHRDIKPDNIIVRQRDGLPVLIDFGAVRETMGTRYNDVGQTTSSIVIGTPGFMPSEQAVGRPVFSSDIYALGLTAIYLLSGRYPQDLPSDPRTGEILWRAQVPNCGARLAGVISRAIASHPNDRFPTAREAVAALAAPGDFMPMAGAPISPLPGGNTSPAPAPIPTVSLDPLPTAPPPSVPPGARPGAQPGSPPRPATPKTDATVAVAPVYNPTVPIAPPATPPAAPPRAPQPAAPPDRDDHSNRNARGGSAFPIGGLIKFALLAGVAGGVAIAGANVFDRGGLGTGSVVGGGDGEPTSLDLGATNTPDSFYFLADSAFKNADYAGYANSRVEALKQSGFGNAGWFWVPEYANLFGTRAAQVFAGSFGDLQSCVNVLENYRLIVGDAYCAFASRDPNADRQIVTAQSLSKPTPTPAPQPQVEQIPAVPAPSESPKPDRPNLLENVRGLFDGPTPLEVTETYFEQIDRGNLERSWEMLAPSYRDNASLHPNGFESYREWWGESVESVEVRKTRLVEETETNARVEASLFYVLSDGREIESSMELAWVREGNRWLCYDAK
ncbi:MAG: protein kinase [Geitlerinemataceae cyanobacterium]